MFQEALEMGRFTGRLNEAKLSMLPKPGGDHKLCTNYRPLSLLNSDIKVLAKLLANRLMPHMTKLIHGDQNGFIPGRDTSSAIRRVFDVMASLSPTSTAALVSFDAYKAFDTLNWDFLFQTMEAMGIGPIFCGWVRLLYADPTARLIINDTCSDVIKIASGTRQGCPLSALLFAIGIEPLLRSLNRQMAGAGIRIGGIDNLSVAYADDLLVFLARPELDLDRLLRWIEEHGRHSGFTINWDKSIYFPIGEQAKATSPDARLTTKTKWFKYLGVKIARNVTDLLTLNYDEVQAQITGKLAKWSKLPLNFAARVTAIKMSILPKLLYIFRNVPIYVTKKYFNKLRAVITQFIWNAKTPRIAYNRLTKACETGGFELPNMHDYYRAAQLQHVAKWFGDGKDEAQVRIEMEWFGVIGASRVLMDSNLRIKCKEGPPTVGLKIWRDVIKRISGGSNYSEYMTLWDVSAKDPTLKESMFAQWTENGVVLLQDLFENGRLKNDKDLVDEAGGGLAVIMRWSMLKACLLKRWNTESEEPRNNSLITHILTSVGSRHQVSKIYKILRSENISEDDPIRAKWNELLEEPLTDTEWHDICIGTKTISFHMRLRLVYYRYLNQAYYTPLKLNAIYKRNDIVCEKCGESEADFIHMVWACEKVASFWSEVCKALSEICQIPIQNTIREMLLCLLPRMPILRLRWAKVAITAAKLLIARRWMKKEAPSISEWMGYIEFCAMQEEELENIMPRTQAPKDIWADFRNYLFTKKMNTNELDEDTV